MTEIVDLDSADAKNRDSDFVMNSFDTRQSDRLVIRFRWSRENRTEPNVIRAFAIRCQRLLEAVRGFSDENMVARFLACVRNRILILPDVNAFNRNLGRDLSVIVND